MELPLPLDFAESAFRFFDTEFDDELELEARFDDVGLPLVDDAEEPLLLVLRLVAAVDETPPMPMPIIPDRLLADEPAPAGVSLSKLELLPAPKVDDSFGAVLLPDLSSEPNPELLEFS